MSKQKAEQKAWDISKSTKLNVAAINPSLIIGRVSTSGRESSFSVSKLTSLLNGMTLKKPKPFCSHIYPNSGELASGVEASFWGWINVTDVARAHIKVMQDPSATGRFLCSNRDQVGLIEIAQVFTVFLFFPLSLHSF